MKIEVLDERKDEDVASIIAGLRAYNASVIGYVDAKPLLALAKSQSGELLGGVVGRTVYKHFLIELVWIAEGFRRTGLGRRLMSAAEAEARNRGCVASQVDTLSFQGLEFYGRLGFDVIGQVDGYPEGYNRYFMLKKYA